MLASVPNLFFNRGLCCYFILAGDLATVFSEFTTDVLESMTTVLILRVMRVFDDMVVPSPFLFTVFPLALPAFSCYGGMTSMFGTLLIREG